MSSYLQACRADYNLPEPFEFYSKLAHFSEIHIYALCAD